MTIKNYTFFSQSGTEFPVSATADRRLYLMLGGMDYSTFKMNHWKTPTNTALNRVYNDTSLVLGGAYFELNNQSITLRANATNFIHVNIDLSNVSNPVSISTETRDNSNSIDMNTTSSVLKKCIEVIVTSGTEIRTVSEKEQETKLKKVTADTIVQTAVTKTVASVFGISFQLTRVGNMVTVNVPVQIINFIDIGENKKANEVLPLGFRPKTGASFGVFRFANNIAYPVFALAFLNSGEIRFTNTQNGYLSSSGSVSYFTDDAMPAT